MKVGMHAKFALFTLVLLAASPAFAQMTPQSFSADYSTAQVGGKQTTSGKIYLSPPKMRFDSNTAKGLTFIGIIDTSSHTMDMIMPAQHMYMEMNTEQKGPMGARAPKFPTSWDASHPCKADETCNKVGTETVNGRSCDKWVIKTGQQTETAWIDQKLHFPIKSVSDSGDTWELTNIKEGKPDSSLFSIPAGYQKMDLGNMGGQRP